MRTLILSVFAVLFLLVSNSTKAQSNGIFINQNGEVIEVSGTPAANLFYIDKAGHLRSVDNNGLYIFDGSNVVPISSKKEKVEDLSRGENPPAPGSAATSAKYYIGEDMQMHEVENGWPERSFHTNEYGKLLENKGKKKPRNSTN